MGGPVDGVVVDVDDRFDRRLTGGLLLAGAALALIGNVAHPIIPPDAGVEAFLEQVEVSG